MEEFIYQNIFDTKGIEYLLVIAFFLTLIVFWKILNYKKINKTIKSLSMETLNIPQGIFYSKNHTWLFMEKSGSVKMGLDDMLLNITGDIEINNLKNEGEIVNKGDLITQVNQNGKTLDIFSPLSGKVVNINDVSYNEDPYGKGWIYKITPFNWNEDNKNYYFADDATNWFEKEIDRFKNFLVGISSQNVLQDGGEIRQNVLKDYDSYIWKEFQSNFINSI